MTEYKIFRGDSVRFQEGENDVCTFDWRWRGVLRRLYQRTCVKDRHKRVMFISRVHLIIEYPYNTVLGGVLFRLNC